MGQQQEIVAGNALVRRIILVLAVAAVMAAMVTSTAAPAFASVSGRNCTSNIHTIYSGSDIADALKEVCGAGHERR
jgi:hypothetical protein